MGVGFTGCDIPSLYRATHQLLINKEKIAKKVKNNQITERKHSLMETFSLLLSISVLNEKALNSVFCSVAA